MIAVAQFEPLSRSTDVFRELNALILAGSEELVRRQLEHAQTLIDRRSQEMMAVCTQVYAVQAPSQWPEVVQNAVRSGIETTRDCIAATAEFQAENLRLAQKQAAEAQKILVGALNDYVAAHEQAATKTATAAKEKR